jgi:hypothetical protein
MRRCIGTTDGRAKFGVFGSRFSCLLGHDAGYCVSSVQPSHQESTLPERTVAVKLLVLATLTSPSTPAGHRQNQHVLVPGPGVQSTQDYSSTTYQCGGLLAWSWFTSPCAAADMPQHTLLLQCPAALVATCNPETTICQELAIQQHFAC